jgi:hypothetical protein
VRLGRLPSMGANGRSCIWDTKPHLLTDEFFYIRRGDRRKGRVGRGEMEGGEKEGGK